MKCEREQQVIEATRNGLWTSSLRAHLRDCAHCRQTELIAASLQEDAAKAKRALDLPPAGLIWRRAQTKRREAALQRATRRPFLIAGTLGAIYSMGFLLWGIFQLPPSVYRPFIVPSGLTGNMTLAGAGLSAILAIIGSFVLLLETKR
jgi:predicted anti-sigma-YlaC factor YlaD